MTEKVTAALDEIRERRKLASSPDLFDRYDRTGASAALRLDDVPRLLAALDAVLARHVPVTLEDDPAAWCDRCMDEFGNCETWPCAEYQAISRALLGDSS